MRPKHWITAPLVLGLTLALGACGHAPFPAAKHAASPAESTSAQSQEQTPERETRTAAETTTVVMGQQQQQPVPVEKQTKKQHADGQKCGSKSSQEAIFEGVNSLEPYEPYHAEWNPLTAMWFFDPCAPLSAIAVTIVGATASSPYHILLYHYGEYLGTATKRPGAFSPEILSTSPSSHEVTYRYPLPGEPNAAPSGRHVATFTWDDSQQKVVMKGGEGFDHWWG